MVEGLAEDRQAEGVVRDEVLAACEHAGPHGGRAHPGSAVAGDVDGQEHRSRAEAAALPGLCRAGAGGERGERRAEQGLGEFACLHAPVDASAAPTASSARMPRNWRWLRTAAKSLTLLRNIPPSVGRSDASTYARTASSACRPARAVGSSWCSANCHSGWSPDAPCSQVVRVGQGVCSPGPRPSGYGRSPKGPYCPGKEAPRSRAPSLRRCGAGTTRRPPANSYGRRGPCVLFRNGTVQDPAAPTSTAPGDSLRARPGFRHGSLRP